jgi:hypothetical protein
MTYAQMTSQARRTQSRALCKGPSRVHLTFKRLSRRFKIETLERHWDRIISIITRD